MTIVSGDLPSACLACGGARGIRDDAGWLCVICGWRVGDVPDSDLPAVRVEVVYYLRFRDRIKIGTSGRPRARLAQLRYEELLAFERGGRELEQQRHAQFADARFPGSEWFVSNHALTRHIRVVARGTADPWSAYARWMAQELTLRVSRG
jgi:hypothetical protein